MDNTIYSSMLTWIFQEVYADLDYGAWKSCLDLSSGISVDPSEKSHSCLLEFHHIDNLSIDVSFCLSSSFAMTSKVLTPHWWQTYLSRCDKLHTRRANKSNFFFGEFNADIYRKKYDPMLPYCLPDCHFFEFDKIGNGMKLAGIFQRVDLIDREYESSCILGLLERASEFAGSALRHLPLDQILQDLCAVFGLPLWLGLMCGRNRAIKLVFHSLDQCENNFELALRWFSSEFGHQFRQIIAILKRFEAAKYRICLDLSLSEYIDSPRFCIEIVPYSVVQEARTLALLRQLQEALGLPVLVIKNIEKVHQQLPRGIRRIPGSRAFVGCENESILCIASNLSHYKICFTPFAQPVVKTYVNLFAEMC